jgi:adenylate cyclase
MPQEAVGALPLWRRFHVKTTLLFGVPVLVLLAALAISSYRYASDAEIAVLRGRIHGLAVGLSHGLDPHAVLALERVEDHGSPAHRRLRAAFARIAALEPDVESIYVLRPTDRRGTLRFAADWVRTGTPGEVGELYDATQTDGMLDAFSRPVVETRIYADEWGRHLSGYAPIRDDAGEVIAIVGIDMRAQRVEALERQALITTGIAYGIALVLFVVGGALLGRNLRRPIERIIDATGAIAAGSFGARTHLRRADELGLLAERLDGMAQKIEERDRMRVLFGRYVSEDVARGVLESDDAAPHGARAREVTALFVDLRRYSTISEGLAPHDVLSLLNEYFSAMTEVLDAHGGCIVELVGDAILAVFGAPSELEDHPAAAVRCALAMRARLDELNREWEASGLAAMWQARGIDRLRARIGVHTDGVVAGTMGSDRRAKYTVLGRAVNAAIELEAMNEQLGTKILVSAAVLARLPEELAAGATARGEHAVRASSMELFSFDG